MCLSCILSTVWRNHGHEGWGYALRIEFPPYDLQNFILFTAVSTLHTGPAKRLVIILQIVHWRRPLSRAQMPYHLPFPTEKKVVIALPTTPNQKIQPDIDAHLDLSLPILLQWLKKIGCLRVSDRWLERV